jgi:hypothetical protein
VLREVIVSDNNHDEHWYDVVCVCALCKPVLNRIASCWAWSHAVLDVEFLTE